MPYSDSGSNSHLPAQGGRARPGWVWTLPALLLLALLLTGNRWPDAPRSFYAAWDQGHIVAFALWTALLLQRYPGLAQRRLRAQLAAVLSFAWICGGIAECLQMLGGNGPPSLVDMGRNLLGALSGWAFFAPYPKQRPLSWHRPIRVTVILLILVSILPLARALFDEFQARRAFPVLASFDQPFELDRWSGGARYEITRPAFAPQDPMLKIDFQTTLYSGVALNHFPRDWRGFQSFAFSIYNPEDTALELVCRINDRRHSREGHRYGDRFNRGFSLSPGWSHIRIPMEEISAALEKRRMEIDDVLQVGIFTISLPAQRTLYLDDMYLVP